MINLAELHTEALEMDRNRATVLEQATDDVLRHLVDTVPAHELAEGSLHVSTTFVTTSWPK